MRYVAFLRGINVGGHKPLKMADLRKAFEDLGFADVRTVQASGNVVFEAGGEEDSGAVAALIETELERMLDAPIGVIVRPLADLERLVASDPFRGRGHHLRDQTLRHLPVAPGQEPQDRGRQRSPDRRDRGGSPYRDHSFAALGDHRADGLAREGVRYGTDHA